MVSLMTYIRQRAQEPFGYEAYPIANGLTETFDYLDSLPFLAQMLFNELVKALRG